MTKVIDDLMERTREAMRRPERESAGSFLWYWIKLALIAITPMLAAVAIHYAVVDNINSDCLAIDGNVSGDGCMPAAAADSEADPAIAVQTAYRGLVLFGLGLAVFGLIAATVLIMQTRSCLRHWRTASNFSCSGREYRLKQPSWLWFFAPTTLSAAHAADMLYGDFIACILNGDFEACFQDGALDAAFIGAGVGFAVQFLFDLMKPLGRCTHADNSVPPDGFQAGPVFDVRAYLGDAPLRILPATVSLGLLFGGVVLHWTSSSWVLPGFTSTDPALPGDASRYLPLLFALSFGLLFSVILMSGMLITSYAREYPSRSNACRIASDILDDPLQAEHLADDMWQRLCARVSDTLQGSNAETYAQARYLFQPNPTFSTSPAQVFDKLVRVAALPLALVMVTALIAFALWLDVLAFQVGIDGDSATARNNSEAALILLLGVGLSVSFVSVTLYALVRLDVFVTPAPAGDPAPQRDIHVSGVPRFLAGITGSTASSSEPTDLLRLSVSQRTDIDTQRKADELQAARDAWWDRETDLPMAVYGNPDMQPAFGETVLRRYMGAGKDKFTAILSANTMFAEFQDVMGKDLKAKLLAVLTGLAPAIFPTIFKLFE